MYRLLIDEKSGVAVRMIRARRCFGRLITKVTGIDLTPVSYR